MNNTANTINPRQILVIKLRHLGDVLLTTPVYPALAEHYPGAMIAVCVNSGTEGMLQGNEWVRRTLTVPRRMPQSGLVGRALSEAGLLKEVRKLNADLVIDLTGNDRSAILTRFSGAKDRWGYERKKGFIGRNRLYTQTVRRKPGVHVIEQQIDLLRKFGIETKRAELTFEVPDVARMRVEGLAAGETNLVHVHPVSRVMEKCWPVPFMAEFLDYLAGRGLRPVITASNDPGEKSWVRELLSAMRSPALDLSGQLSLQELGALSQHSRLFVGVDSAPMHIAAAVGTPVIGIFGPSSENLWGPWCKKKLILSRDLPCRLPCKDKRACPHIECLRGMTPRMILPQVDEFLQSIEGVRP